MPVIGGQLEDVGAGRREARGRDGGARVAEGDGTRTALPGPTNGGDGIRFAVVLHGAAEVGLSRLHHHPVHTGRHGRREIGRCAGVIDPPLKKAGGGGVGGIEFQPELAGGDVRKSGGVELAPFQSQAAGIGQSDKGSAVPIHHPAGLGETHPAAVVEPVNVHLPGGNGLAPIVLHPLRSSAGPVAVGAVALVIRVGGDSAIVEGRNGLPSRNERGGGRGHDGQIYAGRRGSWRDAIGGVGRGQKSRQGAACGHTAVGALGGPGGECESCHCRFQA